jgi:hypothetical protein
MNTRLAVLAIGLALFGSAMGCRKKPKPVAAAADAAPAPQLPAPFAGVRLGMSVEELRAAFPPLESIDKCVAMLVGGDPALPAVVLGQETKPRSQCPRAVQLGGVNEVATKQIHTQTLARRSEAEAPDFERAWIYAVAQVRGAVRAGALDERVVLDASNGQSETTAGAVVPVSLKLADGSRVFSRPRNNGRPICAAITESCDDIDPARVRRYVEGGYSLGQLDADAHSRVVDGKCRGAYLRNELRLQRNFVYRTGAFGAIGLARSARRDRKLDPEKTSSYATYSVRSKLDEKTARAGVLLANALAATEKYWTGAVALLPDAASATSWSSALVWLSDGKVSRVLLNVADETKLGELEKQLELTYGKPGKKSGTVAQWALPDGASARLDLGAAVSLVVEAQSAAGAGVSGAAPAPSASGAP